jgi:hypothetical protein
MIRSRSLPNIGSFPTDPIEIECKECGRHGRYSKAALIKQYGDDVVLPDLLAAISGDCEKRSTSFVQACGAIYPELVQRRHESG